MKTPKRISQEAIEAFKAAYHAEFKETLTDEQVQEIAINLLQFFEIMRGVSTRKDSAGPVN